MRLLKVNINAPHDWKGDLSICIKTMKHLVIFCAAVLIITLAFLPIYQIASKYEQPYDVYTIEDWQLAVKDPFINTIILHEDITLTEMPKRKITFIRDF